MTLFCGSFVCTYTALAFFLFMLSSFSSQVLFPERRIRYNPVGRTLRHPRQSAWSKRVEMGNCAGVPRRR